MTASDIGRIDHIGVIVDDINAAAGFLRDVLGLTQTYRVDRSDLRAVFFALGDVSIEVIEVLDPTQRAIRLGASEARIEHIAIEVNDLESTLERLKAFGVTARGAIIAAERYRTVSTDPETTDGVQYQLVERP